MLSSKKLKDEVITFKVDPNLAKFLRQIPNKSQFIRSAILSSIDHMCPVCQGSGILSPDQKRHWLEFSEHHAMEECNKCGSVYPVCNAH
jgi:hypothetical protein